MTALIADLHMPGERAVVRKNDVVPNRAIVPDVAVGEKISAVADARFALLAVLRFTVTNSRNVFSSPISR